MKSQSIRIYVDTNVLVNYCTGQQADVDALTYVFSKRRRESSQEDKSRYGIDSYQNEGEVII